MDMTEHGYGLFKTGVLLTLLGFGVAWAPILLSSTSNYASSMNLTYGGSLLFIGIIFNVVGYLLDRKYLKENFGETPPVPIRTRGLIRYIKGRKEIKNS